jgi:hypothetical protein
MMETDYSHRQYAELVKTMAEFHRNNQNKMAAEANCDSLV